MAVERELTALCLHYFVFDYFTQDLDEDRLRKDALRGQFAFQDYACANWIHHFRKVLADGYNIPRRDGDDSQHDSLEETAEDLEVALKAFVAEYNLAEDQLLPAAEEACSKFSDSPFYKEMQHTWNHLILHDQKGTEMRNTVSIPALNDALIRNRKIIESLSPSDNLTHFYGAKPFKCPKTTCRDFHEGFPDASTRDQHLNRHDRPFICNANASSCTVQLFGFTSNRDLDKHMKMYHPDLHDLENSFPKALKPTAAKSLTCDHCPKTFTRGFHKRNHMRTHFGERPFACEECGRAFTRANDCKRHGKVHLKR
jgi:hypothetical protein